MEHTDLLTTFKNMRREMQGGSADEPILTIFETPCIAAHPNTAKGMVAGIRQCLDDNFADARRVLEIHESPFMPEGSIFGMNDAGREMIQRLKLARLLGE